MPISNAAKTRLLADVEAALRAEKLTYAERLRKVQAAADPPLTNAELSLGLDLEERDVGRFVSDSPRLLTARPPREVRVLVDALLGGTLVVAVRAGLPGGRREVLVLEATEARRLDRTWAVLPIGAEVGLRVADLEEDDLWSLGVKKAPAPTQVTVARRKLLGRDCFPIAFGTLRLSTQGRPSEPDALAVLHAALDAGADVLDVADSYCLDEDDLGYGERLVAKVGRPALVLTKAGLRRPGGKWVPDGSPKRLRSSCEGSLRNLEVEALDALLLHVVDPKVPIADSVGALAELRQEGKVRAVGLCNVTVAQIDEARAIVPIEVVQNEVSRFAPGGLAVVTHCERLGIPVLAHRPLGGHARRGHPFDAPLADHAGQQGVSAQRLALAWMLTTARNLIPLVGSARADHVRDSLSAAAHPVSDSVRDALDRAMFTRDTDEIVVLSGPPAAGKTSRVQDFLDRGYGRLNRDELGGKLDGLVPRLEAGIAAGKRKWVLDNTYPTRASRRPVVKAAQKAGIPVRCLHLDTPQSEALYNAALRLFTRHGRLLSPVELASSSAENDIPPDAIFRWFRSAEPPDVAEGFARVERVAFQRRAGGSGKAILLDVDGTLRDTISGAPYPKSPDDVRILPGRAEKLRALASDGFLLLGCSNQSGIARGDVDVAGVEAGFARMRELLGLDIPVRYCPHPAGAIKCWCRKPMPGLGVAWIEERGLDRTQCLMVGDMDTDRQFAGHVGVRFVAAKDFFAT